MIEEIWRQTTRGVHFGGSPAFFSHCSPTAPTPPLIAHMRERVGATAPQGVKLAQLVQRLGTASAKDREELLRQAVEDAEALIARLQIREDT